MTSKLTREENVQAVFDLKAGYTLGLADVEILKRVARMALAAMDSEPNRNPVLAYADSYRDMEKQGVESVPIWSVITDLERNIAPLYRHAQQPVVPEEKPMPNTLSMYAVDAVAAIAEVKGWNACRAAMLNHPSIIQPNTDAAPGTEIKHPSSNSPVIPEGYVMVPKEPTAEMVKKMRYHVGGYDRNIKEGYKAMLAAAPQELK